jgi:uncharacterized membrane protein
MQKREKVSKILLVFFAIFFIISLLHFLSPLALPRNSVKDLSGLTGISDNEIKIKEMSFPWNFLYIIGDRLCHQKAERSFFLNGNQMPFCSRCTAIWIGIAIGLGFMILYKLPLNEKFLILIILGIIPIGIDGIGQLLGFWESTNFMRVITGSLVGIVCGLAIGLIIDEVIEFKNK